VEALLPEGAMTIVEGTNVCLRDPDLRDLRDVEKWSTCADLETWFTFQGDAHEEIAAFKKLVKGELPSVRPRLEVCTQEDLHIGWVCREWVERRHALPEIALAIPDATWFEAGFGAEAMALWTDYLFVRTSLRRLGLTTWSGQDRIGRCAMEVGYVQEGVVREGLSRQGAVYDLLKFGILRKDWERIRSRYYIRYADEV
jgi:RimJ/RimL family protein N-acetyltransferase